MTIYNIVVKFNNIKKIHMKHTRVYRRHKQQITFEKNIVYIEKMHVIFMLLKLFAHIPHTSASAFDIV